MSCFLACSLYFFSQIVWKQGFSAHWVPEASLWNYIVTCRNIATVLPLQGCCFHHGGKPNLFFVAFYIYFIQIAQKMSGHWNLIRVLFFFFSPNFLNFLSDRSGSPVVLMRSSGLDRRNKGLAHPLAMNMSGWRNTTQHVPCCFPVSLTYLLWHPHHYPGLVLTR